MLSDTVADASVLGALLDTYGKRGIAPSTLYTLDSRSFCNGPLLRIADSHGHIDVPDPVNAAGATGPDSSKGFQVHADNVHVLLPLVSFRACALLAGQQHPVDPATVVCNTADGKTRVRTMYVVRLY